MTLIMSNSSQNNSDLKPLRMHYFLSLAIFALTGFEYFYRATGFLIFPLAAYTFYEIFRTGYRHNSKVYFFICLFVFVSALQFLTGHNQNIFTTIILGLTLVVSYFTAQLTGRNLVLAFINVTVALATVSLFFFTIAYSDFLLKFFTGNFSKYFVPLNYSASDSIFTKESNNILIYNFREYNSFYNRNSGPFWEAGMFVVILDIALFFNLLKGNSLFSYKSILLIITIITTFSTTGYIGMFMTISLFVYLNTRSKFKFIFVPLIILIAYNIFSLDFMGEKIANQIDNADVSGVSRFGAILIHMQLIKEYPLLGIGDGLSTYMSLYTDANSTANGLSLVLVKFGIIVGLLYFVFLFRACISIVRTYSTRYTYLTGSVFFTLLIILGFSQDVTVRFLYFFLIIWGIWLESEMRETDKIERQTRVSNDSAPV